MHFSGKLWDFRQFALHEDAETVKGFYPVKDKESYYGISSHLIAAGICWFLQLGISNLGEILHLLALTTSEHMYS